MEDQKENTKPVNPFELAERYKILMHTGAAGGEDESKAKEAAEIRTGIVSEVADTVLARRGEGSREFLMGVVKSMELERDPSRERNFYVDVIGKMAQVAGKDNQ